MPVTIKARELSLAINEADTAASLETAYEVAAHFGLKKNEAAQVGGRRGW